MENGATTMRRGFRCVNEHLIETPLDRAQEVGRPAGSACRPIAGSGLRGAGVAGWHSHAARSGAPQGPWG
jgi:hypothetical protein